MIEYTSSRIDEILRTHGINMQNANRCIARHRALVETLDNMRDDIARNGE